MPISSERTLARPDRLSKGKEKCAHLHMRLKKSMLFDSMTLVDRNLKILDRCEGIYPVLFRENLNLSGGWTSSFSYPTNVPATGSLLLCIKIVRLWGFSTTFLNQEPTLGEAEIKAKKHVLTKAECKRVPGQKQAPFQKSF